jgi:hypothetical protein
VGNAWNIVSDVHAKEHFRDLDGEDVLTKLARIPIREWNYITGRVNSPRRPPAQDFRAAFGLGEDDRTISTLDPDGNALRAVQALDARTHDTQTGVARLKEENAALVARAERLERELIALRRAMEELKRQPR